MRCCLKPELLSPELRGQPVCVGGVPPFVLPPAVGDRGRFRSEIQGSCCKRMGKLHTCLFHGSEPVVTPAGICPQASCRPHSGGGGHNTEHRLATPKRDSAPPAGQQTHPGAQMRRATRRANSQGTCRNALGPGGLFDWPLALVCWKRDQLTALLRVNQC